MKRHHNEARKGVFASERRSKGVRGGICERYITDFQIDSFLGDRKRCLDYFWKKIAATSYLYYSDTFQLLITNKGGGVER